MAIPAEIYEQLSIHDLIETINSNLACNINSLHDRAKVLFGKERENELEHLEHYKDLLIEQIDEYLKIMIKNIIHKLLYYDVDLVLKNLLKVLNK